VAFDIRRTALVVGPVSPAGCRGQCICGRQPATMVKWSRPVEPALRNRPCLMKIRKINDDVYYAEDAIVRWGPEEIEFVGRRASESPRGRARICAHQDAADRLHEMIIGLDRRGYVQPHKHRDRTESFHVFAGKADVVIFDEAGAGVRGGAARRRAGRFEILSTQHVGVPYGARAESDVRRSRNVARAVRPGRYGLCIVGPEGRGVGKDRGVLGEDGTRIGGVGESE
jgi:hypothetical protein